MVRWFVKMGLLRCVVVGNPKVGVKGSVRCACGSRFSVSRFGTELVQNGVFIGNEGLILSFDTVTGVQTRKVSRDSALAGCLRVRKLRQPERSPLICHQGQFVGLPGRFREAYWVVPTLEGLVCTVSGPPFFGPYRACRESNKRHILYTGLFGFGAQLSSGGAFSLSRVGV